MTLKELLNSCDFKEIAPFIVKNYPEHEYMLTDYKMAFDILRNMKPEINPDHNIKEIKIEWGYDGSKKYISVYSCEGDYWQSSLAKEIIVSEELTLSDHEIAAHCLWSLTSYGFCESDCDEFFNSLGNFEKRFPSRKTKIEKAIQNLTSNTKARIHSFNDKIIQQFLGTTQEVINQGFTRYSERVLFAMKNKISLSELQFAYNALQKTGLQDHLAEEIIPYNETLDKARLQGLPEKTINLHKYLIATNFNMWNIYNRLTTFASHNEIWDKTDAKRQKVLTSASTLLNKAPDIKQFMQIL